MEDGLNDDISQVVNSASKSGSKIRKRSTTNASNESKDEKIGNEHLINLKIPQSLAAGGS